MTRWWLALLVATRAFVEGSVLFYIVYTMGYLGETVAIVAYFLMVVLGAVLAVLGYERTANKAVLLLGALVGVGTIQWSFGFPIQWLLILAPLVSWRAVRAEGVYYQLDNMSVLVWSAFLGFGSFLYLSIASDIGNGTVLIVLCLQWVLTAFHRQLYLVKTAVDEGGSPKAFTQGIGLTGVLIVVTVMVSLMMPLVWKLVQGGFSGVIYAVSWGLSPFWNWLESIEPAEPISQEGEGVGSAQEQEEDFSLDGSYEGAAIETLGFLEWVLLGSFVIGIVLWILRRKKESRETATSETVLVFHERLDDSAKRGEVFSRWFGRGKGKRPEQAIRALMYDLLEIGSKYSAYRKRPGETVRDWAHRVQLTGEHFQDAIVLYERCRYDAYRPTVQEQDMYKDQLLQWKKHIKDEIKKSTDKKSK